ncbi:hypothetical protein N7466_004840 [Penicillium verhagenii]|uniref:uncharacterized protein n=1 Tax=Penicillium verhagenii TaxID=1562060 RepID=UPI002544FA2B|nr:uncharacterized protein N7466_004840 [Penicillium verhagenii]KAJ5935293.1 hypothetical protein N7466_004840 [Penicillium verhagenii]
MPPKKARNTMRAATFTPSRRSSRVPPPSKTKNESDLPSKPLSLSSTDHPSENIVTFRYYNPKTPTQSSPPNNPTPDLPSTNRRTFQARPSRLSNVYTPLVETPKPSSQDQSSRKTRRSTAALSTPQNLASDPDASEGIGSTGWTYDQYMGGTDETQAPPSPSAASSKGTRLSSRLRKPTSRAIEAMAFKKDARKKTTQAPNNEAAQKNERNKVNEPLKSIANAVNNKALKGKSKAKGKKTLKQQKAPLTRIDLSIEAAGQKLYDVTVIALSAEFQLPSDPEWELANARFGYFQAKEGLQRTREDSPVDEDQPNLYDSETDAGSILQYRLQDEPTLDESGWLLVGCTNRHGEAIILSPDGYVPYWPPQTYNDKKLPHPPVRSRSAKQTQNDINFGFPPLMGDRNIPLVSRFLPEDVTEELALAQVRGEARQRAIPPPTEPRKPRAAKRQSQLPWGDKAISAAETAGPKTKRARASLPAPPSNAAPPAKKSLPRSAKSAAKNTIDNGLTRDDTETDKDGSPDPPFRPIRLVLTAPRPEGKTNGMDKSNAEEEVIPKPKPKKEVKTPSKGKKRAADTTDEPALDDTAAAKRACLAGSDVEPAMQKGGKRKAVTTPKPVPASKTKGESAESPKRKETPRGRGGGRGNRGGGGRGRGSRSRG